ncbi:MAG: hypothetical protein ACLQPD_32280 [Desulfomonilaceae bacterium]
MNIERNRYFLSDRLFQHALETFTNPNFDAADRSQGDWFFETFGPGNNLLWTDKPYERFCDYECLLAEMEKRDQPRYRSIHKGTPFYFMAWTAFEMENYEKAIYYMDAAISEDIRQDPENWLTSCASTFLILENPRDQVAMRAAARVEEAVAEQISRFSTVSSLPLTKERFVTHFVKEFVKNDALPPGKNTRSIITALYTFILEYHSLYLDLRLRSTQGGSIEPFIVHLFKGGLIFESLLKELYGSLLGNRPTLNAIFRLGDVQRDFGLPGDIATKIGASTLQEILDDVNNSSIETVSIHLCAAREGQTNSSWHDGPATNR